MRISKSCLSLLESTFWHLINPKTINTQPSSSQAFGELMLKCSPSELALIWSQSSNSPLRAVRTGEAFGPCSLVSSSDPTSQRQQSGTRTCSCMGADEAEACMSTRAAPLSHLCLGWVSQHHYQPQAAGLEPVCPALPGGLNRLSPHSQSALSKFSYWHQYLQREDFTVVVQPFFRNTLVPLNEVSCGHFWEARM